MKKPIKVLLTILFIVALVFGAVFLVKKRKMEIVKAPLPETPPLPVVTAEVKKGALEITEDYLAVIEPMEKIELAPRVTGHLLEVRVREGDVVKKGQILAVLDSRPFKTQYNSIKAQLEGAKSTLSTLEAIYQRDLVLYKNKAISEEQFERSRSARDEALARVKTLEESLENAKLNLEYCVIKAPTNGVITRRIQDPGDLALPGKPVLEMEVPESGYKVVSHVPQELIPRLEMGGTAYIYPSLQDKNNVIKAKITRIYPAIRAGTLGELEIDLPSKPFNLPSGSTVDVTVVAKLVKGFIVPTNSLLHTTKGYFVFAVSKNETVRIVGVKLLGSTERLAAVEGNLAEGERVVVGSESVLLRLKNGEKVKPVSGDVQ
ncbi:RND family efflux transporter MFP subunit [Thermosulfidibacter takaii ABI70S6]|uniref:RND family efflux transporter MFP subunit n=1 Tax=Thermosulfidibacter takaii (strain DSM 17441 / JCM 13301 / NBRC 103674 / ABI70S6) TaxID=1298851 RepID=A0A0S3QRT7_THET7|nr:efflux RND transporter periplasmic adaptor subunit [Thermosulfidibacter takaii]BAT71055.1 RND family efflux transporter MFP subunit [Thermosulfidibacter takaii ABI70S6]